MGVDIMRESRGEAWVDDYIKSRNVSAKPCEEALEIFATHPACVLVLVLKQDISNRVTGSYGGTMQGDTMTCRRSIKRT